MCIDFEDPITKGNAMACVESCFDDMNDSLEDDEFEDIDKEEAYYIAPNSNTCYIIDSLTLISSLITLTYTPFFLSNKFIISKFKR